MWLREGPALLVKMPWCRNMHRNQKHTGWTSLVAWWLRIHFPVQGTWVQTLVQEDPTYHIATKPMTTTTKYMLQNLCSTREATTMRSPHSPPLEKAREQQQRPRTAKKKKKT